MIGWSGSSTLLNDKKGGLWIYHDNHGWLGDHQFIWYLWIGFCSSWSYDNQGWSGDQIQQNWSDIKKIVQI